MVATFVSVAVLIILGLRCLGFRTQQRLTVGDWDLVVVGVYFTERQEAVRFPPYSTKAACNEGWTRVTRARSMFPLSCFLSCD